MPLIVIIICIVINASLTFGIFALDEETDIITLYTPANSEALENQAQIKGYFNDESDSNFMESTLTDFGLYGEVLIRTDNDDSILQESYLDIIKDIDEAVREITASANVNFTDVCALFQGQCVVTGEIVLSTTFKDAVIAHNVTYPFFQSNSMSGIFGNIKYSNGIMEYASILRLRYNLKKETSRQVSLSKTWEDNFLSYMQNAQFSGVSLAYSHSRSMETELTSGSSSDITLFILTLVLMVIYAAFVGIACNLNWIAWRQSLVLAGVFGTMMAVGGAFGLCSLFIKYVAIVGVMPFLIIGECILSSNVTNLKLK